MYWEWFHSGNGFIHVKEVVLVKSFTHVLGSGFTHVFKRGFLVLLTIVIGSLMYLGGVFLSFTYGCN